METGELQRMSELGEIRKQRELTADEIIEGYRLFKKAMLEPDTQPLKTHSGGMNLREQRLNRDGCSMNSLCRTVRQRRARSESGT